MPMYRSAGSILVLISSLLLSGCGGDGYTPPSIEALLSIENVAKWYQLFRGEHGGKPPADEEAFLAFINSQMAERGQPALTSEELFKSPRDGEPYVIRYAGLTSRPEEQDIVVHERSGENGTKLVATEMGRSMVVDDTEFQSFTPRN